MGMITYGPGTLILTRLDLPNPTPINSGYVNEFSLEDSGDTKQLFGATDYPLAVRRSTIKTSGKMKNALLSCRAANVLNGCTVIAGTQTLASLGESAAIPGAAPFTVVAANGSNFDSDLGPIFAATNTPLVNVGASGTLTGTGQYKVSAGGTYTFDSVDAGLSAYLNYAYKNTTGGGFTKTTSARLIGQAPTFQIDYVTTDAVGGTYYVRVFNAIASKFSRGFKITDFMMPELDFEFGQNAAGLVYMESYSPMGA